MEALKIEAFRSLVILLQALTLLIAAWIGHKTWKLSQNSTENKPKIEETRENVSRLINGRGVQHDKEKLEGSCGLPDVRSSDPQQSS